MSTIDKLLIQGIRSFGPHKGDEQEISFTSPLSLIVGVNGSGKTTIIECLKYALTGEMPPGSDRGAGFVHDPKIDHYSECLGQVKLQVRDTKGTKHIVTRSMKCTQKTTRGVTKTSFETVDVNIFCPGVGQSKGSLSKRVADMNAEMCDIMGVSKAILNNVIFCHQEDSSWPLDEQKRLKEKFDAIFDTTQYNKVIDKFIKMRKSYTERITKKTGDLRLLESHKLDAEAKVKDMERLRVRGGKLSESLEQCAREKQPLEERLEKILKIEMEYSKLHSKLVELQTELKNKKEHREALAKNIKEEFEGGLEVLEVEIVNFDRRMQAKRDELMNLETRWASVRGEEDELKKGITQIQINSRLMMEKITQEQNLSADRARNAKKLTEMLRIVVTQDLENSNEAVEEILPKIDDGIHAKGVATEEMHSKHERAEEAAQKAIDDLRSGIAKLESEIEGKNRQMQEKRSDQEKIQREIDDVERSQAQLKDLEVEIARVAKDLENLREKVNEEETKREIDELKATLSGKQKSFDELDEEIHFLSTIASSAAGIAAKEKQLEEREQEAKRIRNKHAEALKDFFPQGITGNFRRSVTEVQEKLQREIQESNAKILTEQKRVAQLEANRKSQMEELKRLQAELTASEEEIYQLCHTTPYEEVVKRLREQIDKSQLEHGSLKSSESLYKIYIEKMKETPCCPLCHKDMQSDEVENLSSELKEEIQGIPKKADKTDVQLKQLRKKYDALMALKPVTEKLERLRQEIPGKEEALKSTVQTLSEVITAIEDLEMTLLEPEEKLKVASNLVGDMSILDDVMRLTSRLQSELECAKEKLPSRTPKWDMEDAQLEKSALSAELKETRKLLESKESVLLEHKEQVNGLRETSNRLERRQIDLQKGVQALSQLRTRIEELRTQVEQLGEEIGEAKSRLVPLNRDMEVKNEARQRLKAKNRELLAKEKEILDTMKRIKAEIATQSRALREIKRENLQQKLEQLQRGKSESEKRLAIIQKDLDELQKQVDETKTAIAVQDVDKRQLLDNRELKRLQRDEEELEKRYAEMKSDIGGLNIKNMAREKRDLQMKQEKIVQESSKFVGQKSELEGQIERLDKELSEPRYKDAVKNHRSAMYELVVLKKTVNDLNQYRMAVEWALIKYHSEKMVRINMLIKDLWMEIYRGHDIDFIQIKTDESALTGSDRRRSYNYRVVQVKNGVEIDMRGRCSAGQRVLASIIIRIALAETFSLNCNVLALDEPTTNLDYANVESLGEALSRLVDKREMQSNFMLIIITHDETFLQSLRNFDYFYRVKQDKGKSVIVKHRRGD
ncbi:DNA repair protein RAD50 [Phlebotomus argentipes]|uniref:DNA repair protein RAD50 n=1 Tax=Phlebotomus argentipes TaxID=94469 RepID=UPI002892BC50|nr:DNA repair protein RAD50 [Phlebotomus argentipes]